MVNLISLSVVDRGFKPRTDQSKDCDSWCFSAKHAALRRKSKDWVAENQDIVSEWGDMSIHGLLFQWASTIKIQLSMLVYYKADLIISLKINLFSPSYSWKIAELTLNNNHSLTQHVISRRRRYKDRIIHYSIFYYLEHGNKGDHDQIIYH